MNTDSLGPIRPETYRGHSAYLGRDTGGAMVVGSPGCAGTRWFHGPLCFERFTTDREPEVVADGQGRLVIWQPYSRIARPKGWLPGLPGMSIGMTGYAAVAPDDGPGDGSTGFSGATRDRAAGGAPGYQRAWSSHARRHAARWHRSGWIIREITVDQYLAAYARSTQDMVLRAMFGAMLRKYAERHGDLMHVYGVSPPAAGDAVRVDPRSDGSASADADASPILAGFVCLDVPETAESLHVLSFICDDARDSDAGTGLMDHWFRTAPARGMRWLDFGIFWRRGDPRSWKGFSRFKSQFGIRFLDYPAPFLRFTSGRPKAPVPSPAGSRR